MKVLVNMITGVPAAPGAPTVPSANIRPIYPDRPEADAVEHWLLGNNDASLIGLKGASSLSPAGEAPSYGAGYISISTGTTRGLLTSIPDGDELTVCAVVKLDATPSGLNRIIAGTSQAGTGDGAGFALYNTASGGASALIRPNSSEVLFGSTAMDPADGAWGFHALAIKGTGVDRARVGMVGGIGTASAALATAYSPSTRNVALGNAYYVDGSDTFRAGMDVAEFIVFDRALTASELALVYQRSKGRMAARGIEVY